MTRRGFVALPALGAFAQARNGRAAIDAHIDANLVRHIERIREYIRQPSVSAENNGIKQCADLTRRYLAEAGCQDTAIVPTAGHPGVWGYLDAGARRTLVIYWMYDVQPANASEWSTPPFEARLVAEPAWGARGRIIRGRGASNQKGPERAFLNAVESVRAAGRLPVNLMFVCEGEEELGSPHLKEIVGKYSDRLAKAHGVLFPSNTLTREGRAAITLGSLHRARDTGRRARGTETRRDSLEPQSRCRFTGVAPGAGALHADR